MAPDLPCHRTGHGYPWNHKCRYCNYRNTYCRAKGTVVIIPHALHHLIAHLVEGQLLPPSMSFADNTPNITESGPYMLLLDSYARRTAHWAASEADLGSMPSLFTWS